jgi:hypothetical protein
MEKSLASRSLDTHEYAYDCQLTFRLFLRGEQLQTKLSPGFSARIENRCRRLYCDRGSQDWHIAEAGLCTAADHRRQWGLMELSKLYG